MRAQEKVPKEKGTRSPRRPCRYPAFLAIPGARITRQTFAGLPQTGCAPLSRNGCGTRRGLRDQGCLSPPRRRSRASRGKPGQARPCLSESSDKRDRESGERRFCRDAQETRVSGQASGPPFFGVLFFGGAKKSTSPDRAKTDSRKRNQYLGSNRSEPEIRWIAMTMSDYGATHLI